MSQQTTGAETRIARETTTASRVTTRMRKEAAHLDLALAELSGEMDEEVLDELVRGRSR